MGFEASGPVVYLGVAAVSALLRYPIARLQTKVYNRASMWYVPDLKERHSVVYDDLGYGTFNKRELFISWLIFPLIPFYWLIQAGFLARYVFLRIKYWAAYGKFDEQYVPSKIRNIKPVEETISSVDEIAQLKLDAKKLYLETFGDDGEGVEAFTTIDEILGRRQSWQGGLRGPSPKASLDL